MKTKMYNEMQQNLCCFWGKLEINEKRYNLMLTYEDGSAIIANVAGEHSANT